MQKSFESMVLDFKQKINELQTPPGHNLTEEEFGLLRKDRELRSKSVNYALLNEESKAAKLESEILAIQPKVMSIKEKLKQAPSGLDEIYKTIAATKDSVLHKMALKILKTGLAEYAKVLKEIEESEEELFELHNAVIKNARNRGVLEHRKFNLFVKMKQIEKALPAEKHKAVHPERAPEWPHFLPSEDAIGKAYGSRAFLVSGRY